HVDFEVALQHLRIDLAKISPAPSYRVVDENVSRAETPLYVSDHGPHLALVRDVAGRRVHVGKLLRKAIDELRRASKRDDTETASREALDDGSSRARPHPRHDRDRFLGHLTFPSSYCPAALL